MGRTESSEFRGAALKRAKRHADLQEALSKLTPEQIAAAEAAESQRQELKRQREEARMEGLKQAAKARRLDISTAQAQAARLAELERLTKPTEAEIRELLTYTESELAAWVARRVYQISKLALAGERPDFKSALAATLAIEDIVRRYRQATQGKSELWLTSVVKEAEVEDGEEQSVALVESRGELAGGEGCSTRASAPEVPGVDQERPVGAEVLELRSSTEASLPPRGHDAEGGAEVCKSESSSGSKTGLDGEDEPVPIQPDGGGATEEVLLGDQLDPANDVDLIGVDWTSAIAQASSSLTDACPACGQLGGLTKGRVVDGEQWLDCQRCHRTEVKRG